MSVNNITIKGNLVRTPELKSTGETAFTSFDIAFNRRTKRNGEWVDSAPHFFTVKVFGKTAERCVQSLSKGMQVFIVGYLTQDKWTTQDGENRSKVCITATDVVPVPKAESSVYQNGEPAYVDPPTPVRDLVDDIPF